MGKSEVPTASGTDVAGLPVTLASSPSNTRLQPLEAVGIE